MLTYITLETAVQQILALGPGCLLAKIDIKSAFKLLPVHPADRYLLGMKWKGDVYLDCCLPFVLRSAPRLFNVLADLLEWILKQCGVSFCTHYLDDFLTIGPPDSFTCQQNLQTIQQVCKQLGIPLALEKVEGPSTSLDFLGITLDTGKMEGKIKIGHQRPSSSCFFLLSERISQLLLKNCTTLAKRDTSIFALSTSLLHF